MAAKLEQYLGSALYNEFMNFVLNSSRVAKSKSKSKPKDNNYQSGLVRILEYYEKKFPKSPPLKGNEVSIEWWINFLNLYNKNEKGLYDFDTPNGQHGKNGVKDYINFLFARKKIQSPSALKRSAKGDFLVIQKDETGEIIGLEKTERSEKTKQQTLFRLPKELKEKFRKYLIQSVVRNKDTDNPTYCNIIETVINKALKKGLISFHDIKIFEVQWVEDFFKRIDEVLAGLNEQTIRRDKNAFERFKDFLKQKPEYVGSLNLILYGPPGTGKTYHTIDKAVEIITGESVEDTEEAHKAAKEKFDEYKKNGQIRFVTFHQSYGYEEFIQGIKPVIKSEQVVYEVQGGIFKSFCDIAKGDTAKNYVFIIDEINRGNVAKIFGELITLIEEKKRLGAEEETTVVLPYRDKDGKEVVFGVPQNVYILGTMNTADRSLVQLDAALRRRFRFNEMMPRPDKLNKVDGVDLELLLTAINERICVYIDREHQIGHSYFMKIEDIHDLRNVFQYEIIPLLQEYFYEDYEGIAKVLNENGFIGKKPVRNIAEAYVYAIDTDKIKAADAGAFTKIYE